METFFFEMEWPLEKLKIKTRTGRNAGTGIYVEGRNGHRKETTVYCEWYKTDLGEMSPEQWKKKTMEAITANGLLPLLEKVKAHCREHCAWLHTEEQIEVYAMECLAGRAFLYWKDF